MRKKLTSNEICSDIKYAEINKNYCFFRIDTSEKYIKGGASFLDLSDLAYVKSVVFDRGKSFYIMTATNEISRSSLTKALGQYDGGNSLSINQLRAEELQTHTLIQLFLNSLSNPDDELCTYNNLSGKLLCYKPKWLDRDDDGVLWGLNCIEIRVNKDMCLQLSAHRMTSLRLKNKMHFEKRKIHEYPQYEFSYNNHTLRRVSGEKLNDKANLIQKPIEGDRGQVTFFDFSNYDAFSCTKNGILYDVVNLLKIQFADYMTISFREYDITKTLVYSRKQLEEYKDTIIKQLHISGINVIDEVQSSSSESYLQDLCTEIEDVIPGVKCKIGKRLSKGKVNIRYIHDKQFYDDTDPHKDNLSEYVVQHITVENSSYKTKATVMNILKELIIKQDIKSGKINIINWSRFNYENDWIFGMVIDKEYYFMTIHPDGTFEIQKMKRDIFSMTEYDSYMDYFGVNDNCLSSDYYGVIGLIKDSNGNINLIKDTNMYTLSDFMAIGDILKNVSGHAIFSGEELSQLLRDTMSATDDNKVRTELEILIPTINAAEAYDKTAVMHMLRGMNTKKAVVKSVYENTGVMLYAYMRGEDARNEYLSGTVDINYIKLSKDTARFCVGEIGSGMKYSIDRASVIREVQAVENSLLVFDEVLPLMGVEFVRYGMLTVMPFPFKYLREFATIDKK